MLVIYEFSASYYKVWFYVVVIWCGNRWRCLFSNFVLSDWACSKMWPRGVPSSRGKLLLLKKFPGLISKTLIIGSLCVFFKHILIVPFIISLTFVVCFRGVLLLLASFVLICCPFVWNLKKLGSFYSSQMLWFSKQV